MWHYITRNGYANSGGLKRESGQRCDEEKNMSACQKAYRNRLNQRFNFVHNSKIVYSARNALNWKQIQFNDDGENKQFSDIFDLFISFATLTYIYRMYVHEIDVIYMYIYEPMRKKLRNDMQEMRSSVLFNTNGK